ncbi:MAG: 2-hydroxychromene-2-carboxylate isomerase [Gammaproteobacteria bacterium]|nr:2-hydroxychromene-2-carboxylate isomerase [Gammaproteobacteria bacterium]
MNNPSVQFMFDFGSPNTYFCHKVIPDIEARTGATFEYVPILLGGLFKLANNRSPMEAFAGIPNKQAYDKLEIQRFIAKHRLVQFRFNPFFPVNTLQLMRGAVAAQKLGHFKPYIDAMYVAMWEQGRNMNDLSEIGEVLTTAGIDKVALLEASQHADVKSSLVAYTQSAFDRGAFGSPTFFVNHEIFFGKDRLREVEEAILAQSQSK